jgi:integrase
MSNRKTKQDQNWPRKVTFGRVTVTVYKRKTPAGKDGFLVENYSGEKRRLDSYKTEADALEAANKLAKQLSQRDVIGASMTREQAIEFASVTQSLQPLGISLTAAVSAIVEGVKQCGDLATIAAAIRFFKAKHRPITQKSVADVVAELLTLKKTRGAMERYLEDLKFRLEKFAETFQCSIGSVTAANVQAWLDSQKKANGDSLSTQSYANNRRVVGLLCKFAASRGYAHENVVEQVDKVKIKNGDCEVFTPDEAQKLMANAPQDFLPCLALGLFAGIRSAEIERLKWQDIDLKQGHIVVGKGAAKTAARRIVPISENLALWLAPYADKQGSVWSQGRVPFHKREHSTAKAAGISWKRNAMRHSFASYTFALLNDAGRVAGMCGNSAKVIHRHYKQLVTQADAQKFFAVKPPQTVIAAPASAPMLEAATGN